MHDDPLDRDLAQRLRAYESRLPDANAPSVGEAAQNRSIRRLLAIAGVIAAVAAGGLAAVPMLNIRWGNVGDQPIPGPTNTPPGIAQLSVDDPRRDCAGNAEQVVAVYQIPNGAAFWTLFPEAMESATKEPASGIPG